MPWKLEQDLAEQVLCPCPDPANLRASQHQVQHHFLCIALYVPTVLSCTELSAAQRESVPN